MSLMSGNDVHLNDTLGRFADGLFFVGSKSLKAIDKMAFGKSNDWSNFFKNCKMVNTDKHVPLLYSQDQDKWNRYYVFTVPEGMCLADFTKNKSEFSFHLHVKESALSIERYGSMVRVIVSNADAYKTVYPFYAKHLGGMKIPLGFFVNDHKLKLAYIDLTHPGSCHMLIGGSTGCGKSNILKIILLYLMQTRTPEEVQFSLCDGKDGTELFPFIGTKHVVNYADAIRTELQPVDGLDIVNVITKVSDMIKERNDILKSKRCKDIQLYHKKGFKMPYHILVIDEFICFQSLPTTDRNKAHKIVMDIVSRGRSCGIHVIITNQSPHADIVPGPIKNNLPLVIGMKCKTPTHSEVVCGVQGLENIPDVGMARLLGSPHMDNVLFKSMFVPEDIDPILEPFRYKPLFSSPESSNTEIPIVESVRSISGFVKQGETIISQAAPSVPTEDTTENIDELDLLAKLDALEGED